MKRILFVVSFLILCLTPSFPLDIYSISLKQCEEDALSSSPQIKQLAQEVKGAHSVYNSSKSSLYPSLSLDAKGSWVSDIPSLEIANMSMEFGDNWGYSVGPTANYILFDNGARNDIAKSTKAAFLSKEQEFNFALKQVLLQVRQAYFTVLQDLQHIYLLTGQLTVARKQMADVKSAFFAGAKSKLDISIAQKQVYSAQANISAARGYLSNHLINLFKLTGTNYGINPLYPLDSRLDKADLAGNTTSFIKADSIKDTLKNFTVFASAIFDEDSPRLLSMDNMIQYYNYLSDSYKSLLYPRVILQGGTYFEYPNGPIKEHIFLGRAGATISIPLFEGGKNTEQAKAQKHYGTALQYNRQDTKEVLEKLFTSCKSWLYSLSLEETITENIIQTSKETAQLTYQAYQAGVVTFFEVDRANLELLTSQITLADLQIQQLNNLAVLDSLSKERL